MYSAEFKIDNKYSNDIEIIIMIKYIFFFFTLCTITSCVSTNFESYQSIDNLKKDKKHYEIIDANGKVSYVEVGLSTLYNIQNHYSIYISFKGKDMTATSIRSSTFGEIPPSSHEKIYLKKIDGKPISDTVYISFPNKVYTFHYK